jgi:mannan endo-1,4-beta-mannosidase
VRTHHLIVGALIASLAVIEFGVAKEVPLGGRAGANQHGSPAGPGGGKAGKPSPAPVYDISHLLAPAGKFFGVALSPDPTGPGSVDQWERQVGRNANMLTIFESFNDGFAASQVRSAYEQGALAVVRWEPYQVTLADIAAGRADGYITKFAKAVRELNLPMAMTFAHEMNGGWYPWGTKQTRPSDYVAAWRRVHDLFRAADARNVIWVWTPNVVNPVPSVRLRGLYPGDGYVDWIGMDGYYTHRGQHTFAKLFGPTMKEVQGFTQKPFLIVETAAEPGTTRPAWIKDLVAGVANDRHVLGFAWFDMNGSAHWKIDSDAPALAAFRQESGRDQFDYVVK